MRLIAAIALFCLSLPGTAAPDYRIETVAEGLRWPWSVAFLPDGRWLVTERAGRLRIIEHGRLQPQPVGGVPPVYAASQGGLFEVLPAPDFARSQQIYLSFAHGDARANATRVVRARLDGHALHDLQVIFTARPWKDTPVHYGGRMAWMPDGSLLLGLGDGFDYRESAQDLRTHLGSIVRLDADGRAPPDNPFSGRNDALPEIWSYGHRNVQGLVVDPRDGAVYAHEHGPRGGDELNRICAGCNYGWPAVTFGVDYTGALVSPYTELPGMEPPLLHWTPSHAPSGMSLYLGQAFGAWHGDLLISTLVERSVRRVRLRHGQPVEQEALFTELGERLRDVRVSPEGHLILLTDAENGRVLRVTPNR